MIVRGLGCSLRRVVCWVAIILVITTVNRFVPERVLISADVSKDVEMTERSSRMRQVCSQYPVRRQVKTRLGGTRLFYISEKHNLSYCRVAKVGSTFWTQVFMTLGNVDPVLNDNKNKNSLFDVPRDETHQEMKKHKDLTMEFRDERVHTTTSFLVSRNPYSRLFSSYVDQIFLPNKWSKVAYMVDGPRRQCGNGITFEEFLLSISTGILNRQTTDLHWAPIFSICLPCESGIDLLAKQETFNDDADYILNMAGVDQSVRNDVKRAVGETLIEHSLGTLVHTYVSKGHAIKKGCLTEKALAKRLWTAFQIQGYIHDRVPFPADTFSHVDHNGTEKVLLSAVLDAVKSRKLSSEERDAQRQSWKVRFWQNISTSTLNLVQDAYYEDFHVFGYDIDPSFI